MMALRKKASEGIGNLLSSSKKKEIIVVPPFEAQQAKIGGSVKRSPKNKVPAVPVVVTEDVEVTEETEDPVEAKAAVVGPLPVSAYYKSYTVTAASTFPSLPLPAGAIVHVARKLVIQGQAILFSLYQRPNIDYIVNANGTFRFVSGVLQANDEVLLQWTPAGYGN